MMNLAFEKGRVGSVRFSGHESFPFRYAWLTKGYGAVSRDQAAFLSDEAAVTLGVGKNMVRSIRHWLLACRVGEEIPVKKGSRAMAVVPTPFGKRVFGRRGLDPYLEDEVTLWLLHWNLATNSERAPSFYILFSHVHEDSFSRAQFIEGLTRLAPQIRGRPVAASTIKRDVDVLLRTYTPGKRTRNLGIEETLDCPLVELGLLRELGQGQYFFTDAGRSSLPGGVLAWTLLSFLRRLKQERSTLALDEAALAPGSPGRVFRLPLPVLAEKMELVEAVTEGRITLTETAGLRQIVFCEDLDEHALLKACYSQALSGATR